MDQILVHVKSKVVIEKLEDIPLSRRFPLKVMSELFNMILHLNLHGVSSSGHLLRHIHMFPPAVGELILYVREGTRQTTGSQ